MYVMLSRMAGVVARLLALAGGALLVAIVVLTVVSIAGRALFSAGVCCGPIRGIYDYTEIAVGAAIFAFLPWCQYMNSHAAVDLFKSTLPDIMNRSLNVLIDVGMLVLATLVAHRLWLGLLDKQRYGETTLIAQIPVWIGYAACLVGAVGFVLVAAFCVIRSARGLIWKNAQMEPQS
ncbi:TRAP-type C4-dicarboxylate transport system permease small subunit [Loktanella sp. PT4BL]|jgi:TRAP-type C4-dicarboxylate transport system permease small subunit|uniref:TRAP transporter small permease n=1 Tax=Loktanella sp. PT4BL TaxID=2135611 RepID=UPI000D8C337F|nr:TRAP transporter small permease [Loktanella sp. PT4BL]PXW70810.1 TRAP-type C4-dicarboxylate transport system permease small subunit [Loktanella sp. PT4BL]